MLTITVTAHNAQTRRAPALRQFRRGRRHHRPRAGQHAGPADPDRKISRTHATVAYRDGAYRAARSGKRRSGRAQRAAVGQWQGIAARGRRRDPHRRIRARSCIRRHRESGGSRRRSAPHRSATGHAFTRHAFAGRRATGHAVATRAAPDRPEAAATPADTEMTEPVLSWASDAPAAPGRGHHAPSSSRRRECGDGARGRRPGVAGAAVAARGAGPAHSDVGCPADPAGAAPRANRRHRPPPRPPSPTTSCCARCSRARACATSRSPAASRRSS